MQYDAGGGTWVTLPVYAVDGPIRIVRGYSDEGVFRATKVTFRLNDAAAPTLNPAHPNSPWYGKPLAIPIRVLIAGEGVVRAVAEIVQLDPDQTPDYRTTPPRGKRWLDVQAYGTLFRVGQWSDPLRSPMTRTYLQYPSLIGFWPGDDAGVSTWVGQGRTATDVTGGDASAPPGASGSFAATATTRCVFSPNNASATAGFQVFFSTRTSGPLPGPPAQQIFQWFANALQFSLEAETDGIHLKVFQGGVLLADSYFGPPLTLNQWIAWRAKCYQSGSNVICDLASYVANAPTMGGLTITAPGGQIDRPSSLRITGNPLSATTKYCQIGVLTGTSDDLQSYAAIQSVNGYAGELTTARFARLLAENGLAGGATGTSTTRMGPQKASSLTDQFREIAATEDGLVYDSRTGLSAGMKTRSARINVPVGLALQYSDCVSPLQERLDNVGAQNIIAITDVSGATATATRTTGPMSSAPYPNGIGPLKGGAFPDVKVNFFDPATDLRNAADWYLARGTVPPPRYPSVTIEVGLKSPGLRAAAAAVTIGDRLTITGRNPEVIDLQIIGLQEEIRTHTRTFTFVCIPNDVFNAGAEDSAVHALQTYASTILTAPSPPATGVSMVVGSPDAGDTWSQATPYPILVSGERMTVTAATAPVLSGGQYRQTLTVVRSVNGVVKAQTVGTSVRVPTPYREVW